MNDRLEEAAFDPEMTAIGAVAAIPLTTQLWALKQTDVGEQE